MELNNWMSKQTGGTKRVRWEHALKPPKHEPTHYAKVFGQSRVQISSSWSLKIVVLSVDDTEHGRGEGRTKDQAEELAAKAALTALSPQLAEQLEKEYKVLSQAHSQ
jgi:hypothetical protein